MDEVELLVGTKGPFTLEIVNIEFAVGGHGGWLYRAEIGADDKSAGEFIGKVNGPNACAGAKVQNALGVGPEGRAEEFPADDETE